MQAFQVLGPASAKAWGMIRLKDSFYPYLDLVVPYTIAEKVINAP